jgi:hypothetical protein
METTAAPGHTEALLSSVAQIAKSSLELGDNIAQSSARLANLLERTNRTLQRASDAVEKEEEAAIDARAAIVEEAARSNRRGAPSCGIRCRSSGPSSSVVSAGAPFQPSSGASKAEMLLAKAEKSLAALENASGAGGFDLYPPVAPPLPVTNPALSFAPSTTTRPAYEAHLDSKLAALEKIYLSKASSAIASVFPGPAVAPTNVTNNSSRRLAVRPIIGSGSTRVTYSKKELEAQRALMHISAAMESRKALFKDIRSRYQDAIKRTQGSYYSAVTSQYDRLRDQLMVLLKNEVLERLSASIDLRSSRPFATAVMKSATTALAQLEVQLQQTELGAATETQAALVGLENDFEALTEAAVREVEASAKKDREKALSLQEEELQGRREQAVASMEAQVKRDIERELYLHEDEIRKETEAIVERQRRALIPRLQRQNELELEKLKAKLEEDREAKLRRVEEDLKAEMLRKHEDAVHQLNLSFEREVRTLKGTVEAEVKEEQARELRALEASLAKDRDAKIASYRQEHRRRLEAELERRKQEGEAQEKAALEEETEVLEEERRNRLAEVEEDVDRNKAETILELHRQAEEAILKETEAYRTALEETANQQVQEAREKVEKDSANSLEALLRTMETELLLSPKLKQRGRSSRSPPRQQEQQQESEAFIPRSAPARRHSATRSSAARVSSHSRPSSASSANTSFSSMAARVLRSSAADEDESDTGSSAVNISRLSSLNPRSVDVSFVSAGTGAAGEHRAR